MHLEFDVFFSIANASNRIMIVLFRIFIVIVHNCRVTCPNPVFPISSVNFRAQFCWTWYFQNTNIILQKKTVHIKTIHRAGWASCALQYLLTHCPSHTMNIRVVSNLLNMQSTTKCTPVRDSPWSPGIYLVGEREYIQKRMNKNNAEWHMPIQISGTAINGK